MQLILPVSQPHSHRLDNFIAGDNKALVRHLTANIENEDTPSAAQALSFLYGASGSGKSHLSLACHHRAHALGLSAQYIDIQQVFQLPCEVMDGLGANQVLCIDNLHLIAQNHAWQIKVFDLINQFLEAKGLCLVLTADKPLASCQFSLPDLHSRLQWGTTFQVKELSDENKMQALRQHFKERGIVVESEALRFVLHRAERDMHELMRLVSVLDEESLQSKRKMTVPFIKQTLSI